MSDSPTLLSLAARVEKLTGPCRETDALIALAVSAVPEGAFRPCAAVDIGTFAIGSHSFWTAPAYTASLDAAMTLVSEGYAFYVRRNCSADRDVVYCNAQVWPYSDPRDNEAPRYWANSPEDAPAIALVAACLKARAALEGNHE